MQNVSLDTVSTDIIVSDIVAPAIVAPVAVVAKPKRAKLAKPAPVAAEAPATPSRDISRTASTIAANRTNFGGSLSDRDNSYISFFASFVVGSKPIAIRTIAESGRKPNYSGSAKPYDAGVCNRLRSAGVVTIADDGASFTFTKLGRGLASYAAGAPKAAK